MIKQEKNGKKNLKSLGFDGKVKLEEDLKHIPPGVYKVRAGLSLPTSRYSSSNSLMLGCVVIGFIPCSSKSSNKVIYLYDCQDFSILSECDNFFRTFFSSGLRMPTYCSDNVTDTFRMFKGMKQFFKVRYLDPIPSDQVYDIILRNFYLKTLKIQKGSLPYKKLGLFLANPNIEVNAFLNSLGNLLYGEYFI